MLIRQLSQASLKINAINDVGVQYDLVINVNKTEFMVVSREKQPDATLQVGGQQIQRVSSFKYLGATLNEKCDDDEEIRVRVGQAKSTLGKLRSYLAWRTVPFELKIIVKFYVWPVLLYGADTWSRKFKSLNRLEACKIWLLWRTLRIPWTEKVSNLEVLRRAGVEQ